MYRCLTALVLLVALAHPGKAQGVPIDSVNVADTTRQHLVRLRDGSSVIGRITSVSADTVRVRTGAGEMSLGRNAVEHVQLIDPSRIRNGVYWFENPHATRLLFSSTAIPLDPGTGYYSNSWLFFHTFAGAFSDRFTLGGGLFWFPGVALDETVFFLLPKYTLVNGARNKLAIGALAGMLPFGASTGTESAGILYGVGTTGSKDSNLSAGLGWGYAGGDVASNPIIMIGGQHRFARRVAFITENWFISIGSESEGLYSYGLRFLGEGLTVDLAYISVFGSRFAFPWLGFSIRF